MIPKRATTKAAGPQLRTETWYLMAKPANVSYLFTCVTK